MNNIIQYLKSRGGYATMKELKASKFQPRNIKTLLDKNVIEKVKPGLYRISNTKYFGRTNLSFTDVCNAVPSCVICLGSAISFYNLSTFNPSEVHIAVPNSEKPVNLFYPPVKYYFFRKLQYETGRSIIKTKHGDIRIYDVEKTVCDIFRFRNIFGEDIALEVLRNYTKRKDLNYFKLLKYSKICRVSTLIESYLKGMSV